MTLGPELAHASCVLTGARATLIRGPAGSGKSRLALALIEAARAGWLPFAQLVADDRVRLVGVHGRLVASAPDTIRGLIEVRGVGIRHLPCEPMAVVGQVVDLAAPDAARMPDPAAEQVEIAGIHRPRLPVAPGSDAFPTVLAWLLSLAPEGLGTGRPLPSHLHTRNMPARPNPATRPAVATG